MAPGWDCRKRSSPGVCTAIPTRKLSTPGVRERITLRVLQKQRVVAAAHLLRYGNGPEVNPYYQNVGDLA
jgi:hypothetical protein